MCVLTLPKASIDLVLIGVSLRCPRIAIGQTGNSNLALYLYVYILKSRNNFFGAGRLPHEAALAAQRRARLLPGHFHVFCFALVVN